MAIIVNPTRLLQDIWKNRGENTSRKWQRRKNDEIADPGRSKPGLADHGRSRSSRVLKLANRLPNMQAGAGACGLAAGNIRVSRQADARTATARAGKLQYLVEYQQQ